MRSRPFASARLSTFGTYLVALCVARDVKVSSLVDIVGNKTRLSFALRGKGSRKSRGALLTLDELDDREAPPPLAVGAARTQAPRTAGARAPRAAVGVIGMASDLVDLSQRLNAQLPNLDFSGSDREFPEGF